MDPLLSHCLPQHNLGYLYVSVCFRLLSSALSLSLVHFYIFALPFSLILFISSHPLGRGVWVAIRFGRRQAEGGQTRSLCVRRVEQETGRGGGAERVRWGPWRRRVCQKKDYASLLFLRMPRDRKHAKESRRSREYRRRVFGSSVCAVIESNNAILILCVACRWTSTTSTQRTEGEKEGAFGIDSCECP